MGLDSEIGSERPMLPFAPMSVGTWGEPREAEPIVGAGRFVSGLALVGLGAE